MTSGIGRGWLGPAMAIGLGLAAGCGSAPEEAVPSGAPMGAAPVAPRAQGEDRPPVVEQLAIEPLEPVPGGRVRAVVRASDPDGGSVQLRYAWRVGGLAVGGDVPELQLESGRKGQDVEVTVVAAGAGGESAPAHARAELGNRPPRLLAVALEPVDSLRLGTPVKAVPEASDPDDDTLRFEVAWLVNGQPTGATGLELDTARLRRGDRIQAKVRATDGTVTTDAVTSGELQIGNTPPEIVSKPDLHFEGDVLRYDVEARDADGDRNLRYSLHGGPEGMTIDRFDGVLTWKPTPEQAGKHPVSVAVEDSQGAVVVQDFEVTVGREPAAAQPPAAPAPAE